MQPALGAIAVGLGDPVMDIVAHVPHSLLAEVGAEPGGCIAVGAEEMQALTSAAEAHDGLRR
jgi:hypothetical protein